jgi:hypothetical protein
MFYSFNACKLKRILNDGITAPAKNETHSHNLETRKGPYLMHNIGNIMLTLFLIDNRVYRKIILSELSQTFLVLGILITSVCRWQL